MPNLYVGTGNNEVHKADAAGDNVWISTNPGDDVLSVAVDPDGYVYAGSEDDNVYCFAPDGTLEWTYDFAAPVLAVAVDKDGYVYCSGGSPHEVHKILPDGSNSEWEYIDFTQDSYGVAVDKDGYVYAVASSSSDPNFVRLDPNGAVDFAVDRNHALTVSVDESQTAFWSAQGSRRRVNPLDYDGVTYEHGLGSNRTRLVLNDLTSFYFLYASWGDSVWKHADSGEILWHISNPVGSTTNPWGLANDEDSYLYVGGDNNAVVKYDPDGSEVTGWGYDDPTGSVQSIAVDPGVLGAGFWRKRAELTSVEESGGDTELTWKHEARDPEDVKFDVEYRVYDGSSGEHIEVFDTPGDLTWTVPTNVTSVEVLVVAGGGGGGPGGWNLPGGGGGAGGVIHEESFSVTPGDTINLTVGKGGFGGFGGGGNAVNGFNGEDSVFGTLTAVGGGGGSSFRSETSGEDGGSGGGGSAFVSGWEPVQEGGSGTLGQGNDGGDGASGDDSGGGGGYSQAGDNAEGTNAGDGGDGFDGSTIFGTDVGEDGWFAGGGGGGARNDVSPGNGGSGGGGDGVFEDDQYGDSAMVATGGGGGGASFQKCGGNGGSGIIILKYTVEEPSAWVEVGTEIDNTEYSYNSTTEEYTLDHSLAFSEDTTYEYRVKKSNSLNWSNQLAIIWGEEEPVPGEPIEIAFTTKTETRTRVEPRAIGKTEVSFSSTTGSRTRVSLAYTEILQRSAFIADDDGYAYLIGANEDEIWQTDSSVTTLGKCTTYKRQKAFTSAGNRVLCFSFSTGEELWSHSALTMSRNAAVSLNENVYLINTRDDTIMIFDFDGNLTEQDLVGSFSSEYTAAVAVDSADEYLYWIDDAYNVRKIDILDGSTVWTYTGHSNDPEDLVIDENDNVYFCTEADPAQVVKLDSTGSLIYAREDYQSHNHFRSLAVSYTDVVFLSNSSVTKFDRETEEEVYYHSYAGVSITRGGIDIAPEGDAIVADWNDRMVWLTPQGYQRWSSQGNIGSSRKPAFDIGLLGAGFWDEIKLPSVTTGTPEQ